MKNCQFSTQNFLKILPEDVVPRGQKLLSKPSITQAAGTETSVGCTKREGEGDRKQESITGAIGGIHAQQLENVLSKQKTHFLMIKKQATKITVYTKK